MKYRSRRFAVGKKNRARGAAKSREETPKEGIYSQKTVSETLDVALHHCQVKIGAFLSKTKIYAILRARHSKPG
jgi:hypothetical protein